MVEAEPTPLANANYAMLISSNWTNLMKANEPQLIQDTSKATELGGNMQSDLNKMLNTFTTTDQFGESTLNQNVVQLQLAVPIETTIDYKTKPQDLSSIEFLDLNGDPVNMNISNSNSNFTIDYSYQGTKQNGSIDVEGTTVIIKGDYNSQSNIDINFNLGVSESANYNSSTSTLTVTLDEETDATSSATSIQNLINSVATADGIDFSVFEVDFMGSIKNSNINTKTISLTDGNANASLSYTVSISNFEDITETVEQKTAFDTDNIIFHLNKLGVDLKLKLNSNVDITSYNFDVNVFKKPETEGEKVLALEYAMNNIEGYSVDFIVYNDHYLGEYIDGITLDNKLDIVQANGLEFDAISSVSETYADETEVEEFYRINDPVVRLTDFAIQNSTDAKRCVVLAPAMPMDNMMYSSIKKQLEKLEAYKNNTDVQKVFEVLGQNLILSAVMREDISGGIYTDIFTPLSKILNRSFIDSYYNVMIDGSNIKNIVPTKFKDRFYNTGVIFASKKGENVVLPALRTMNFTNMTSVRTIKLINYVLNEAKNKQDAFLGKPSNPINISQIRENIQTTVDKLITAGAIKAGNVYTKASVVGTSIGRVQVKISIIDYFEIKQIDIEATYSKALPDAE